MCNIARRAVPLMACLLTLGFAVPTRGDGLPLFTFDFNDLDGDFVETGGMGGNFTARATSLGNGGPYDTSGDVTRVADPQGTADYGPGFAGVGPADILLEMAITDVVGNLAQGAGRITVTDEDGDTITGAMEGRWQRQGVFANFQGRMTNVVLTNLSGDGTFDGPTMGSFSMDFDPPGPYNDAAFLALTTGGWFTKSFDNVDTQIAVSVLPEPGTLTLCALALAVCGRARRRPSVN